MVGRGHYHNTLVNLVNELDSSDKIEFLDFLPNNEIARTLKDYDLYITSELSPGVSKTVIESCMAAIPVIHNKRNFKAADEDFIDNPGVTLVPDSVDGYCDGIKKFYDNPNLLKELGAAGYEFAVQNWEPNHTEMQYLDLYLRAIEENDNKVKR